MSKDEFNSPERVELFNLVNHPNQEWNQYKAEGDLTNARLMPKAVAFQLGICCQKHKKLFGEPRFKEFLHQVDINLVSVERISALPDGPDFWTAGDRFFKEVIQLIAFV